MEPPIAADLDSADPDRILERLADARQLLEVASTLEVVIRIRDFAEATRYAIKLAGLSGELANAAVELKLRSERKAGELLAGMEKQGPGEYKRLQPATVQPSLADLGIEKTQSHRWQSIAKVPAPVFEQHIVEVKVAKQDLTTAFPRRAVTPPLNDLGGWGGTTRNLRGGAASGATL